MQLHGRMVGLALIAAVAMTTGCVNTMGGKVDGDQVGPARDAIFDQSEIDVFGYTRTVIYLVITGVPDACEVWDEFDDIEFDECDDYCEDLNAVATEYLHHNEYWNLSVYLFAEDEVEIEYDQGDWLGEDEFTANLDLMDVTLIRDVDECEEECEDGDDIIAGEGEDAEDGNVIVDKFDSKDEIKGTYEIEFDSDDEVVSGNFKATHCDLGLSDFSF